SVSQAESRIRLRPLSLVCLVGLLSVVGCGETLTPVEGKVTVDGQPLTAGNVTFYPTSPSGSPHDITGTVANGGYKMNTHGHPRAAGCAPGGGNTSPGTPRAPGRGGAPPPPTRGGAPLRRWRCPSARPTSGTSRRARPTCRSRSPLTTTTSN